MNIGASKVSFKGVLAGHITKMIPTSMIGQFF